MRATTLLWLLAVPAFAQTPTQPTPKPAQDSPTAPGAPTSQQTVPDPAPAPVPLPQWFVEIDTAKKGEVTRADFVKHRMKLFDELDTNKDGKLSLDEFVKVAEPPLSSDVANGPTLEERRDRARTEFQKLDTNRDGFIQRAEIEAVIHAEFNQYDTDRDNKVTEPEVRLIVQRSLQRQAAERQQIEARRRQGMLALGDFIDMQLLEADKLDKNNDGKISQQEYLVAAGPADGAQAKDLLPYDIRRQLVLRKFQEIDTNKDGQIDGVELTAHAVKRFLETDLNKDRFLDEDELKKAQEADAAKMREMIPKLQPPPAAPRPPPPPVPSQPMPAPGPPPGLPQNTR
jgi:Ca2+-binding EF-hand superfamily protein